LVKVGRGFTCCFEAGGGGVVALYCEAEQRSGPQQTEAGITVKGLICFYFPTALSSTVTLL